MNTSIIGIGQTKVGEHWDVSLRHLAWQAIEQALDDAKTTEIEALYVGNMLAGSNSGQEHLGALIADYSGLRGVEAVVVEAGEASGGAAVRQAILAVLSGQVTTAMAIGVEKATDQTGKEGLRSQTTALDAEYETIHGLTPAATAGLMMRRYMHEYGVEVALTLPTLASMPMPTRPVTRWRCIGTDSKRSALRPLRRLRPRSLSLMRPLLGMGRPP